MKKMSRFQIVTLLLIKASIFISSCYPGGAVADPYMISNERQKENTYYVPAAPHIPLIVEQQDINFNLLRASGNRFNGVEAQVAYMPIKKFGIGAGISAGGDEASSKVLSYSRVELMAGYIKKMNSDWHFETYGGAGGGKIRNYHYTGQSSVKQTHFFVQPGLGFSNPGKTVQLAFVSRFAGVNFNVTDSTFNTEREPFSASQLNSLYDEPFHLMWEPSVQFRAGWKFVLFTLQYSHSADLTNSSLHRSRDNFSFGVTIKGNAKAK